MIDREELENVEKGAAKAEKNLGPDHCHVLMSPKYKLKLLEVSHRTIEEIEKARFSIMAKFEGDQAVSEFRNFVFDKLIDR